jgi:hypothetical protein
MHVHGRPNFVEQGPKLVILFFLYLIDCTADEENTTFHVVHYVQYTKIHIYIMHVKEGEL